MCNLRATGDELRCGVHVVSRAAQVVSRKMHMKMNIKAVDAVSNKLVEAALGHNQCLCHDSDPDPALYVD